MSKTTRLFTTDDGRDVTLDDVFREIYEQAVRRDLSIESVLQILIDKMEKDPTTVVVLAPIVAQLMNNSIKNQETGLGKLAALGQRISATAGKKGSGGSDMGITPDELRTLLNPTSASPSSEE